MNKAIIMGRLCADPELRTTPGGKAVTTIRVAVNRRFANEDGTRDADFIDVVCWRQTAEFVAKYFAKGRMIGVVGWLQTRSWTDKDGGKRYATEIVADEAHFCGDKPAAARGAEQTPTYTPAAAEDLEAVDDDDELPF